VITSQSLNLFENAIMIVKTTFTKIRFYTDLVSVVQCYVRICSCRSDESSDILSSKLLNEKFNQGELYICFFDM
jgi:hypothetical protein